MAGSLADYGEVAVLNYFLGLVTKIGLFVTDPGETTSGGAEVSAGEYSEETPVWTSAATSTSGVTSASNSADITFPTATTSWGTVGYWVGFDSGGHRILHGSLTPSIAVTAGIQPRIAAGALVVTLD